MRVEGKTNDEIAKALRVKYRTVVLWWSDPRMKEEINRLLDGIDRVFMEKMAALGIAAAEGLTDMVSSPHHSAPSFSERLRATEVAMDRIPGMTKQPEQTEQQAIPQGNNTIVNVQNMSDAELMRQAKKLAPKVIEGSVVEADDDSGD